MIAAFGLLASTVAGGLHVPRIFSDGAVLQVWDEGDARAFFYGSATPNASVTLTISSENSSLPFSRTYSTRSLSTGKFTFQIDGTYGTDPQGRHGPHYGPYSIRIASDGEEKLIKRVKFGDVYICAGDEAMAAPVGDLKPSPNTAQLHRFVVQAARSTTPMDDVQGEWLTEIVGLPIFSALCYKTALELASLDPAGTGAGNTTGGAKMPIAVILTAVNGSMLGEWAPAGAVACGQTPNAAHLYNGMVAPLQTIALRGVVLSQGKADVAPGSSASSFGTCLRELIRGWRDAGEIGDFSFASTQAASGLSLQLAQARSLPRPFTDGDDSIVDTTSLAPTYDLPPGGESFTTEVARRLALGLVHTAYAKQEPEWHWAPPELLGVVASPEGGAVDIAFGGRRSLHLVLEDLPGCSTAGSATCCANGGGSLVEGFFPRVGRWLHAGVLEVLPGSLDRSSQTLRARGDDWEKSGPPSAVRIAAAGSLGCVLRNHWPAGGAASSFGIPVLPAMINVSNATVAGSHALLERPESPRGPKARSVTRPISVTQTDFGAVTPPPMGFNTWNRWHCWVDEQQLKHTANLLVSLGLAEVGYTFLNVDDCWQGSRAWDAKSGAFNGSIEADKVRFPAGLKAFSDYAHGLGLKWGLYTSQSSLTCQARPGSYGHEARDAQTYCDADVDYLKIDHCGGESWTTNNHSWMLFRRALNECAETRGRKFWMACSSCGPTDCLLDGTCSGPSGCGQWIASGPVGCDVWRTGGDIQARWSSIMSNLDLNALMGPVQNENPGHFNDPDMLQVGNVGLTLVEQRSHFACWCMLGGPLLISTDLRQISDEALRILKARELIALNQDSMATQGVRIGLPNVTGAEVWAKRLSDGRYGVILLNRGQSATDILLDLAAHFPEAARWTLRDLWAESDLGSFGGQYVARLVPSHGNVALLATPARS